MPKPVSHFTVNVSNLVRELNHLCHGDFIYFVVYFCVRE